MRGSPGKNPGNREGPKQKKEGETNRAEDIYDLRRLELVRPSLSCQIVKRRGYKTNTTAHESGLLKLV